MAELVFDADGQRFFETGVDRGVLFVRQPNGQYANGKAWNGLTAVTESPSGAEANKQYADNIVYLNLVSVEELGGTIEAFTYPDEFAACNGELASIPGVNVGQQARASFAFAYRSKKGNDLNADLGYKLHLIWGALAGPSEKAYATVNESPEAMALSWEFTTTAVAIGTVGGVAYKPTSSITIDSTVVGDARFKELTDIIWGTVGVDSRIPTPREVIELFDDVLVEVEPTAPTYNETTKIITIPAVTGVVYKINGNSVPAGPRPAIVVDTVVTAVPAVGYKFPLVTDDDWLFEV